MSCEMLVISNCDNKTVNGNYLWDPKFSIYRQYNGAHAIFCSSTGRWVIGRDNTKTCCYASSNCTSYVENAKWIDFATKISIPIRVLCVTAQHPTPRTNSEASLKVDGTKLTIQTSSTRGKGTYLSGWDKGVNLLLYFGMIFYLRNLNHI